MTNDSLMKVKSIAKCSLWSILQYSQPALRDNVSLSLLIPWNVCDLDYVISLLCSLVYFYMRMQV